MPEKTQRRGVGQAWLAQRVGVTLSPAFIMILLPLNSRLENLRF
jgi:hypothetical protein